MADESRTQRVNRELIELLNELRVALPGVQVLFAFLLTIAFTPAFHDLSHTDRAMYFAAVVLTAASTALLIAPSAHHRLRFRSPVKEHLVKAANVYAITGLGLLVLAIATSLYLVTDVVYDATAASLTAGAFGIVVGLFWFVVPYLYRTDADS